LAVDFHKSQSVRRLYDLDGGSQEDFVMSVRFRTDSAAYPAALASEANYENGHIYKIDGTPALFETKNKIDLGLGRSRDQILDDFRNNNGRPSAIYANGGAAVNPDFRSGFSATTRHNSIRAAYNSLDINFRDLVLPDLKCKSFEFHDMIFQRGNADVFGITDRQQLIYQLDDHFDGPPTLGVRGHADDSLFNGTRWNRNDPRRVMVGLLYLTSFDPAALPRSDTTFAGGELFFPLLTDGNGKEYRIRPEFGDIVYFPASPLYIHAVTKLTAGTRVVVTTWYNIPGYN
jgi:2-oxoglutarate-Fe(II)-dependent oxygenase superfamily protein